jgi:hypothetical protein
MKWVEQKSSEKKKHPNERKSGVQGTAPFEARINQICQVCDEFSSLRHTARMLSNFD